LQQKIKIVIGKGGRHAGSGFFGKWRHYKGGSVACSSRDNQIIASAREAPHISGDGCSPPQNAGRSGWPNTLQRNSASSCTHGTPAGLPFGMPGRGEVMEGAMQQAAQWGRQIIARLYPCLPQSLSAYLRTEFPDMAGFQPRNPWDTRVSTKPVPAHLNFCDSLLQLACEGQRLREYRAPL
jgi:hypothetical protein